MTRRHTADPFYKPRKHQKKKEAALRLLSLLLPRTSGHRAETPPEGGLGAVLEGRGAGASPGGQLLPGQRATLTMRRSRSPACRRRPRLPRCGPHGLAHRAAVMRIDGLRPSPRRLRGHGSIPSGPLPRRVGLKKTIIQFPPLSIPSLSLGGGGESPIRRGRQQ